MSKTTHSIRSILFLIIFIFSISCARLPTETNSSVGSSVRESAEQVTYPWEAWTINQTYRGIPISHPKLREADYVFNQGYRAKALKLYQDSLNAALSLGERETATLRIASLQLGFDRPHQTLARLSEFEKERLIQGEPSEKYIAVLKAYAFARLGDQDQALAWFSQCKLLARDTADLKKSCDEGVQLYLATLQYDALQSLGQIWLRNPYITEAIQLEKKARNNSYAPRLTGNRSVPFWNTAIRKTGSFNMASVSMNRKLGVLLPLTGKYKALGQSTKRGIDLALKVKGAQGRVAVSHSDTAGDGVKARAAFEGLLKNRQPTIVIGPLLSDLALSVIPAARQNNVPLVTFSKRKDIIPGGGIFRLGPTPQSQVESLLNVSLRQLGIQKYAVIYPLSANAQELSQAFKASLRLQGLAPVWEAYYEKTDNNLASLLAGELERKDVEAVFYAGSLEDASKFFVNVAPRKKDKLFIMGSASWDNKQLLSRSRAVLNKVVFVSPYYAQSGNPLAKKFNDVYQSLYGSEPNFLAAQGFDAASLILTALEKEQREGIPFVSAIRSIGEYEGLTGVMSVLPSGEVKRLFNVVQLQDSGIVPVKRDVIRAGY